MYLCKYTRSRSRQSIRLISPNLLLPVGKAILHVEEGVTQLGGVDGLPRRSSLGIRCSSMSAFPITSFSEASHVGQSMKLQTTRGRYSSLVSLHSGVRLGWGGGVSIFAYDAQEDVLRI